MFRINLGVIALVVVLVLGVMVKGFAEKTVKIVQDRTELINNVIEGK